MSVDPAREDLDVAVRLVQAASSALTVELTILGLFEDARLRSER